MSRSDRSATPLWSARALELWRSHADQGHLPAEFWSLVHSGIHSHARRLARNWQRFGSDVPAEVASGKTLEMLEAYARRGAALATFDTPGALSGYLASLARNGLVDQGRAVELSGQGSETVERIDPADDEAPDPERIAAARGFGKALVECARRLSARGRVAWFFRAFHDWPSRDIARHPLVASTPTAVDMLLKRCREKLRRCMFRKGFRAEDLVEGSYVHVWNALREDLDGSARKTE